MAGIWEAPELIGQDWSIMWGANMLQPGASSEVSLSACLTQSTGTSSAFSHRPTPDGKRLLASDMSIFGFAPENENFCTATCSICSRSVLREALHHHMTRRHGLPPPSPPVLPVISAVADEPPAKKLKTPDQPQLAELPHNNTNNNNNNNNNKAAEEEKRSKKKKKRQEKGRDKVQKVFDPNRHCGVENESGRPCLRSILCKVHLVALKRAVPHRRLPYDTLAKLFKTNSAETAAVVVASAAVEEPPAKRIKREVEDLVVTTVEDNQSYLVDAVIEKRLIAEGESPKAAPILRWTMSLTVPSTGDTKIPAKAATPPLEDITWHAVHPKPLATNTFGCRLVGGLLTKNKKLEARRKDMQTVWLQGKNTSLSGAAAAAAITNAVSLQTQQTTAAAAAFKRRRRQNSAAAGGESGVHLLAVRAPQYVIAQCSK